MNPQITRSSRGEAREDEGSHEGATLRPFPGRGAHHVPQDQSSGRTPPQGTDLHLPRHQRPVSGRDQVSPGPCFTKILS